MPVPRGTFQPQTAAMARWRGQRSESIGRAGQAAAASAVRSAGVLVLWPVYTGWRLRWKDGRIIGAVPLERVPGDLWGVLPGGRALLVEAKERAGALSWSDLKPHQHAALASVAAAGGLALVAWVRPGPRVRFIAYPPAASEWSKGHPLKVDDRPQSCPLRAAIASRGA